MPALKKITDQSALPANEPRAGQLEQSELRRISADMTSAARPIRWGIGLLLLGFCTFIGWALFAPIDEGVPAPATVMVDIKRQTVQHLSGGTVREILVREAQQVKAGDVVMRLDDTTARSTYESLRKQYLSLRAQESRLLAERSRTAAIAFHPDLLAARNDPLAVEHMSVQNQLFLSRRLAMQGDQAILEQTRLATQESLRALMAQLEGKQEQLKLVREQLTGTRELAKEGYLPRNRWYEEERLASDLSASVGELSANIARVRASLAETSLRIAQVKYQFLREVETQLADTTREAQVTGERMRLAQDELARTVIRSPADGYVVGLLMHTIGGVIPPGARIMDIIPQGAALTLEARVEPHLVDRISPGLPTDIMINAFVDKPNLVIEGRVLSVSADLIVEQANVPPYYLARVQVTPEGMKALGQRRLQPGMPAEVVIKTGERTFFQYVMQPVIRRMARSFREA